MTAAADPGAPLSSAHWPALQASRWPSPPGSAYLVLSHGSSRSPCQACLGGDVLLDGKPSFHTAHSRQKETKTEQMEWRLALTASGRHEEGAEKTAGREGQK